jgi:hypothetical protein
MSTPADEDLNGVSIYIAAHDRDDARRLFDKAIAMAATGEPFNGELIYAEPPRGVAQLYIHMHRPRTEYRS